MAEVEFARAFFDVLGAGAEQRHQVETNTAEKDRKKNDWPVNADQVAEVYRDHAQAIP